MAADFTLDPGHWIRQRIADAPKNYRFTDAVARDPKLWRKRARQRLALALGGLDDWERPPLHAKLVETRQLDGYRRETVVFTTRPGLSAFGYFLLPDATKNTPRAAVLCLPGHGRGVDSIIGIAENGEQRSLDQPDEYQADFALQCVSHGYAVFALEQISFGHRRGPMPNGESGQSGESDRGASSCHADSMAAQMLGESVIGWRVWDAMRALDYLQHRPEVDVTRLATMGISGGGLTALFTAALDERVRAAVVSGYLNTFADSVLAVPHCVDNYAPGLLKLLEMPDIAGLVAPRALFAESGARDPIFPIAGFEQAAEKIRVIYRACGAADRFETEVFDGDHRFHGTGAFPFLEKQLPSPRG